MKKYIIVLLGLLFLNLQSANGQQTGNCVVLTFGNGTTGNYCGPSSCQGKYQSFGNDPTNNTLKQEYTSCIIIDDCVSNKKGKVYGKNFDQCCLGEPYNVKGAVGGEYNSKCCNKGNIVVPAGDKDTCISCNTLKQEVESFGTMGPYTQEQESKMAKYKSDCSTTTCDASKQYTDAGGATQCCDGIVENGKCITNNMGTMGIDITQECLINGQCKLDIYETLGIRKSLPKETRSSPGIFIQDIILSATFFVGTLITGVLIISGLLYVFAGANGSLAAKAKKGITGSLIGLVFVVGSYAFVRLIQFLITGGGG